MTQKRYSVYANATLDQVLADRLPHNDLEDWVAHPGGVGFRTRSSLVSAIAERYAEIVRRSVPEMALAEWCLIFDALNGCWTIDNAALVANGVAMEVADAAALNGAGAKWCVDGQALANRIAALPFPAKIAIVDTAERFWSLDVQPDDTPATDADPFCCWRAPIRRLVGGLTDD
jgi:hypothetical protein